MLTLLPMPSIAPPITPPPISGRGAPSSWRRTARVEALRTRLRETAARLYARDGIDGVTIADIARAAQIPPGSATHAYPRRRDLLFDIVHAHIDALHEYVGRADDAFADAAPQRRLEAIAMALLDAVFDHRHAQRVLTLAEPLLSDDQRDLLRFQMRTLHDRIAAVVAVALPHLGAHRAFQAPLAHMLMAMATDAPAWFRDDGALSRRDYARLMVRGIVNGGDAMLVAEAIDDAAAITSDPVSTPPPAQDP